MLRSYLGVKFVKLQNRPVVELADNARELQRGPLLIGRDLAPRGELNARGVSRTVLGP